MLVLQPKPRIQDSFQKKEQQLFNPFMTEADIIEKPVHRFAPQINGLVSI